MSVKISFSFDTAAEAAEFLMDVQDRVKKPEPRPFENIPIPPAVEAPVAATPAAAPKPRAKKAKPAASVSKPASATAEELTLTTDGLRNVLKEVAEKRGTAECLRILGGFQISRISELDPKLYNEFHSQCAKAIGA